MDNIDDAASTRDEVIHEVRRIKEALAREHDFDVRRIVEDAQKRQATSGRRIIPVPARQKQH